MPLIGVDLKGAGEAVGSITSGLGDLALKLRSAITGKIDPRLEAELNQKLLELEASGQAAQAKINEVEAASNKTFVAGWRPYLGWVLGTAAALYFIPRFGVTIWLWTRQVIMTGLLLPYPDVGWGDVVTLLGGMLGLGGLRTYEKKAGVSGNH